MKKTKIAISMKSICLVLFMGLAVIACKKTEATTSSSSDTLREKIDSSAGGMSSLDKTIYITFKPVPKSEYDNTISDYDKLFKGTNLKRENFEIDQTSFNKIIDSFRNSVISPTLVTLKSRVFG